MTVKQMAEGLGIKKLYVVANKARGENDVNFIKDKLGNMKYLGAISFSDCVMQSDIEGRSPFEHCPEAVKEVETLKGILESNL
jgi:CO dehydrogenase maturation factor